MPESTVDAVLTELAALDDPYVRELLQTPRTQAERLRKLLPRGAAT